MVEQTVMISWRFFRLFFPISMLSAIAGISTAQSSIDPVAVIQAGDCFNGKEVVYRSSQLIAPNGTDSIYFNAVFRRLPSSEGRTQTNLGSCAGGIYAQTPVLDLVIERGEDTSILASPWARNNVYVVPEPVAFSPDGNYAIAAVRFSSGNSAATRIAAIDLENSQSSESAFLNLDLCSSRRWDVFGMDFLGFASDTEMVIECRGRGRTLMIWYEAINLTDGSVRSLDRPGTLLDSDRIPGTMANEAQIIRQQILP